MIISLANSKGGSGKTTVAMILALTLIDSDYDVCVVDMDPAGNFKAWVDEREGRGEKAPFAFFYHDGDPDKLQKLITELAEQDASGEGAYDFIILDTEGSAQSITNYAIINSDLVIIPIKGDPSEARQAVKLLSNIQTLADDAGTDIAHYIAFTDIGDVAVPREKKKIEAELREHGLPLLDTELRRRQAYKTIKMDGVTLRELASGIEIMGGKALDPGRERTKAEQRQLERQKRSAISAIEAGNNFTRAVLAELT
ncbi:MAG: AAA family ATPase [Maricaulaceae bacterium]